jgi:hypothetical protein
MNLDELRAWISAKFWSSEQVAGWVERHFIRRGADAFVSGLNVGASGTGTDPRIVISSTDTSAQYSGVEFNDGAFRGGLFWLRSTDEVSLWNDTAKAASFPSGASPAMTIPGGIVFANETLNYYDEGTFTPVVADASSGGNTGTGTFTGHYVRIGKMVHVDMYLENITTAGMTAGNPLYARALPYAAKSTGSYNATGSVMVEWTTIAGVHLSAFMTAGGTSVTIWENNNNAAWTVLSVGDVGSGVGDMIISVTYLTD